MARNLLAVGDELQVNLLDPLPRNSAPFANGLLGDQFLGQVATLDNGNFVVVYQNNAGGQGDMDILAIEFTPGGNVARAPFRVDFDAGDQQGPDVAPRKGGGYAAVWEEDSGDDIHLVVVTASTASNPTPEFIVASGAESTDDPSIATFENGNYIVTYSRFVGSTDDIWFAIVNAAGTAFVKNNTGLVTSTTVDETRSKVAASGNLAAIVYERGEFSKSIELAIVNSSGNTVDFETVADITGETFFPDVTPLSDGRFVVAWTQIGESADVFGRIYDPATGGFSGARFAIAAGSKDDFFPTVAGLPDGGFVAAWTEVSGTSPNTTSVVLARRFDKDGAPAGDAFRLSDTKAQQLTAIAANDDGRVFTAWMAGPSKHTTDLDLGINGNIFRPVTETVNGTPEDDVINGYGLSEPINGLGGKDKIDGRGGNDLISGGEGKDKLTGGTGGDGFLFDVKLKGKNADHISDFLPGTDTIILDKSVFKGLKPGELKAKAFFAKKKADEAKDGKDRIAYDTKGGDVWFDKDGKGGSKAKLVATLDGSPDELSHSDFLVVA